MFVLSCLRHLGGDFFIHWLLYARVAFWYHSSVWFLLWFFCFCFFASWFACLFFLGSAHFLHRRAAPAKDALLCLRATVDSMLFWAVIPMSDTTLLLPLLLPASCSRSLDTCSSATMTFARSIQQILQSRIFGKVMNAKVLWESFMQRWDPKAPIHDSFVSPFVCEMRLILPFVTA